MPGAIVCARVEHRLKRRTVVTVGPTVAPMVALHNLAHSHFARNPARCRGECGGACGMSCSRCGSPANLSERKCRGEGVDEPLDQLDVL